MVCDKVCPCGVNWLLVPLLWQESIFPGWETPRKEIDDNQVPFGGSVFRQASQVQRRPFPAFAVFWSRMFCTFHMHLNFHRWSQMLSLMLQCGQKPASGHCPNSNPNPNRVICISEVLICDLLLSKSAYFFQCLRIIYVFYVTLWHLLFTLVGGRAYFFIH